MPKTATLVRLNSQRGTSMHRHHIQIRSATCNARSAMKFAAFMAIAITFTAAGICSFYAVAQKSTAGAFKGQLGAPKDGGGIVFPESTVVYVMFATAMKDGSFTHVVDTETAGGQFRSHLSDRLSKNKFLQSLPKAGTPTPETREQIAINYILCVDEALEQVRVWLANHPDRAWQMKTAAPDAQGAWIVQGLQPGGYEIAARGKSAGRDTEWEAGNDLNPGATMSLPMTRPRFMRATQN
jgi:hypothetical protein